MEKKDEAAEKGLVDEFMDFLNEYKIIGLAIGFIMGFASTALVKSLVDNIVMPLVTAFIPGGAWKTATLKLGPAVISWGAFLGDFINFLVIAIVVFFVFKKFLNYVKLRDKFRGISAGSVKNISTMAGISKMKNMFKR